MTCQAYQIERDGRVLVARPTVSECTGSDITALIQELKQCIDHGVADSVVIELSNVQHMDSCCLGRLLTLNQHARSAGGSIAVARCQPNVAFLFEMTRLDKLLGVYKTTEQAVAELRARRDRPAPPLHRPDRPANESRRPRYAPMLYALLKAHKRRQATENAQPDTPVARPGSAMN